MRSGSAISVSPPVISNGRCVVGVGSGNWFGGRTIHRDADVKRLHSALAEAIPPQSRSSIVHGDYRIDNTILDAQDATKVVAVLDWEMSTLGDPLSDAALMCVYRHPMFNMIHASSAWASPLMPEVDELANRYSQAAGQSLDNWDFYMALGYFKVAIIAAGIAFRARMGGGVAAEHRRGGSGGGSADRRGAQRALAG